MKVLLSAFSCDPYKGSESASGWNWAVGLANEGFEVHCLTGKPSQQAITDAPKPANLFFHFIELPYNGRKLYSFSQPTMYLYYILWQWAAYRKAKELFRTHSFDVVHHVSWGNPQLGSFLYKFPVPFIFGPAGGGQKAPFAFKKYFGGEKGWATETKRNKMSRFLLRYNPASRKMMQKASLILVSNEDTYEMVLANGAKNIAHALDCPVPLSFFPEVFEPKKPQNGVLKLLWVGRFMPRKGLLFVLEIMKALKGQPVYLTVVGDGEMYGAAEAKIKEDGLSATVHLAGRVSYQEVREFYRSHDAFLFTSLRDSGPSQLIESLAFGMPIFTIDLHGQAEIVQKEFGFKFACDSPEMALSAIRDAILQCLEKPEILTRMSIAAHEYALGQSWEKKIPTIVQLYYPQKKGISVPVMGNS